MARSRSPLLQLTFLGGLGDIGRNCAVLETQNEALLIDCGMMFPREGMHGVDLVIPDFSYLRNLEKEIVGCIITHGHEDHHGGLSYLLNDIELDILGSEWTLSLAKKRLTEAGLLHRAQFHQVRDGDKRVLGPFEVEFIPVAHSVPNGYAVVIRCLGVVIFHTGDWKIDLTPIDSRRTGLARIGSIASAEGIDLMLGDSTNADEPGHSKSEQVIRRSINSLFESSKSNRVIVASFASHVHRVVQIIEAATSQGRKIALLGRSMGTNIDLALEQGILDAVPNRIDISEISSLPPDEVCVIATGSQGEPMSALSLMAEGRSRWHKVSSDDVIIFSSTPISGNETSVSRVIDGLTKRGARVHYSGPEEVHTSGHAQQEELKLMLSMATPRYFVPIHGEARHLAAHRRLAIEELGMDPQMVLDCVDGDTLRISESKIHQSGRISARYVYVSGEPGLIDRQVIRERSSLLDSGVAHCLVRATQAGFRVDMTSIGWLQDPMADTQCNIVARLLEAELADLVDRADPQLGNSKELHRWVSRRVRSMTQKLTGQSPVISVSLVLD